MFQEWFFSSMPQCFLTFILRSIIPKINIHLYVRSCIRKLNRKMYLFSGEQVYRNICIALIKGKVTLVFSDKSNLPLFGLVEDYRK